jgi:UDP-N-acetylmuramoyl-tripeptide--D-alanyl-D-alanine ligase
VGFVENFKISDIIKATNGSLKKGDPNAPINGISTDSRTLKNGDLFVALIGERFDAHDFAVNVIEQGAMGVVLSHEVQGLDELKTNIIMVKDTTKALGDIARYYKNKFNITVIGITGSNGKTTTKDMASSILSEKFSVLKSEGNLNNTIGLPLTLFRLSSLYNLAVLEMGISIPGEMSQLVDIAEPKVAVITNVSSTHLEFLGSIDGVGKEKQILVESAESAVLNIDDPYVSRMSNVVRGDVIFYGIDNPADVTAKDLVLDQDGRPEFTISVNNAHERIKLPSVGRHNVYNALAAISVGVMFGIGLDSIKVSLESYRQTSMRMQRLVIDGITIINDTYNSNPVSMRVAVDLLKSLKSDGKKVMVVGDMLELGEQSEELHDATGKYIGTSGVSEILVTVGNRAVRIAESALEAGIKNVVACKTNSEAVEYLRKKLNKGDLLLIKGSRGMKMEQIVEALGKG